MNRFELDKMRAAFRERCDGFKDFLQDDGFYFDHERGYKDDLIRKAEQILGGPDGDKPESVGLKFLELVKKSNFVAWQLFAAIDQGGADARREVAVALGDMLLSKGDLAEAAAAAAERIHQILKSGSGSKNFFGGVRSLATSVLALAKPSEAISIKTKFMQKAVNQLTGETLFKSAVMSASEYKAFLDLARQIEKELSDWKPRDLWDVQGFLWVVTNYEDAGAGIAPSHPPPTGEGEDNNPSPEPMHPLNLILHGPPGTGKTWRTAQRAVEICEGNAPSDRERDREAVMKVYKELVNKGRVVFTTFHQSMGYEEFVEGLRPVTDRVGQPSAGFRLEPCNGIFRNICESAAKLPELAFVLIIDEINRANVSKVLGELITLLEPDKRLGAVNALTVTLPYSKEDFGVPNNLYVIGTMNTADRSIALLDTALRRRFDFEEMMPDYTLLEKEEVPGIHLGNLLQAINRRVEWLFDRDHQIGHSYFISVKSLDDLDHVMRVKVIPLLVEYFYEDWEKVRAVLNDQTGEGCFIIREELPAPAQAENKEKRWRYSVNEDEFSIEGYEAASEPK